MRANTLQAQYRRSAAALWRDIRRAERRGGCAIVRGLTLAGLQARAEEYEALSQSSEGEILEHLETCRREMAARLAELRARAGVA